MVTFKLNKKYIDAGKADPKVSHKFVPDIPLNEGRPEEEKVWVECRHLLCGDATRFLRYGEDRSAAINFREVWRQKVDAVHNLSVDIVDDKGKFVETLEPTPAEILDYPRDNDLDALITAVGTHLFNAEGLTRDEAKN